MTFYETDCMMCPMNTARLRKLAILFSTLSTMAVVIHVMVFVVTSVANGCICGTVGCTPTPLALFGQGLWCGAFGFIAGTLCCIASNTNTRWLKSCIGFLSVFNTFFHSCGALVDGYGAFALFRCHTCNTFNDQVTTFIFGFLSLECFVLTVLATVSFTTAIYAIQWFISSEDTWAGCWFGTSTSSRSNDSIEQTEWILPPRRVRQEAIEKRNNYYDDCWNDYAGQQTLPARV